MDIQSEPELRPFLLSNVERTKSILGMGSFGVVEEVIMNGASFAGKKIHDVLMRSHNSDKKLLVKKIVDECHLMSDLKHPNIVQFFGICFFPDSDYPVIIMEKLNSNLDTLLTTCSSIQLQMKIIIMQDIAKGLNYIHTQNTPIIHRDLTAMNVLLTSSNVAKIADLGNAHIIKMHGFSSTLSQIPGTLLYMPPEAFQCQPIYDTSLDMFSFGHLVLFIMLQEFPGNILSSTYFNPNDPNDLLPRTEIERRQDYVDRVNAILSDNHPIRHILQCCLSNASKKRLTAAQVLDILIRKESEEEAVYNEVSRSMSGNFANSLQKGGSSNYSLLEGCSKKRTSFSETMLEQLKNGEPMLLDKQEVTTVRLGLFKREKRNQWVKYLFGIEGATHLRYYADMKKKKPLGEIELYCVSHVVAKTREDVSDYSFEVHFDGKDSPWCMKACTGNIMKCWMEAIKRNSTLEDSYTATPLLYETPPSYEEVVNFKPYPKPEPISTRPVRPLRRHEDYNFDPPADTICDEKHSNPPGSDSIDPEYAIQKQFEYFTAEQLEHLAQMLDNMLKKKGSEGEINFAACKDAKNDDSGLHTTTGEENKMSEQFNESQEDATSSTHLDPPPLPPKRRRFARAVPDSNSSGTAGKQPENVQKTAMALVMHSPPLLDEPFRERKKAESRRNTIRRIMNYDSKLTKMSKLMESDDDDALHPRWSLAKISEDDGTPEENEEDGSEQLYLNKSSIEDFKLIEAGQFGKIYRGRLILPGQENVRVVMKTMTFASEKDKKCFLHEMVKISKITHPNIVRLYGLVTHDHENLVVLEYMSCGNLYYYLQKYSSSIPKLIKFMVDVAMGMHHLSKMGLVHRDLAARNISVSGHELCKVADFGQLRELPKDGDKAYIAPEAARIPIRWCSPEYLIERKCSSASDVWSYGILLWEMANPGKMPYGNYKHEEIITKIKLGYTLTIPSVYPNKIQEIMKLCWRREPGNMNIQDTLHASGSESSESDYELLHRTDAERIPSSSVTRWNWIILMSLWIAYFLCNNYSI